MVYSVYPLFYHGNDVVQPWWVRPDPSLRPPLSLPICRLLLVSTARRSWHDEENRMENLQNEKEWRCRQCGTLLGVERGGRLHLKYKTAQFVVSGQVMAVCRRCSEISETVVGAAASAAGTGPVDPGPSTGRAA